MIGLKEKKKSLFDSKPMMEKEIPPPEVRITYAENGFIISCDYSEKYVAKTLNEAMKYAKEHFEKALSEEEKQDKKNS